MNLHQLVSDIFSNSSIKRKENIFAELTIYAFKRILIILRVF